jgi:hypothetical protein
VDVVTICARLGSPAPRSIARSNGRRIEQHDRGPCSIGRSPHSPRSQVSLNRRVAHTAALRRGGCTAGCSTATGPC